VAKRLFLAYDILQSNQPLNGEFNGIQNINKSTIEQWLAEMRDQNLGGYVINIE